MAKIKIFHLCLGYFCSTLWVKNSLEITLSLMVFEIFTFFFTFPRWLPKVAKIENFLLGTGYCCSTLHRILLYYPAGEKFARNCSISYGFRDIHTFLFSTKIQDGRQKLRKLKFFSWAQDTPVVPCTGYSCTILRGKNSIEIALSFTVFEIFTLFHFPLKSKMAAKSCEN